MGKWQAWLAQDAVNVHLETWWKRFQADENAEVFVPLCGKSLDMLWLLEQGHRVTGVELHASAVDAFFAENAVPAERTEQGAFQYYRSHGLGIYCGDFFDLTAEHEQDCRYVFDRAALVALPPEMRVDYVTHMHKILPAGSQLFLIGMAYDTSKMSGPPFSVPDEEVKTLFANGFSVERVASSDDPSLLGGLEKRGLDRLRENIYFIHKHSS